QPEPPRERELGGRLVAQARSEHLVAARPAGHLDQGARRRAEVGPHHRAQRPAEIGLDGGGRGHEHRLAGKTVVQILCEHDSLWYRISGQPRTPGVSMSLLRVDSSIRTDGSVSREVADALEEAWSRHHTGPVVRRDLGRDPLPAEAWAAAVTA